METTDKSTIEAKLSQISSSFRLFAKKQLQEEINKDNPSLNLDPDKIYINITGSSETLTDALLKKALGEDTLLSNNLDGVINEHTVFPSQNAFIHSPLFYRPPIKTQSYPKKTNIKALAGINVQGHIKNYTLTKYQKFGSGKESYLDVVQLVNRSRNTLPIVEEIGLEPIDVLTVRNRIGKLPPNLEDLFKSLQSHGIHYDRITLAFCRSNAILSGFSSVPQYTPPIL